MNLLERLIIVSEKAANIARACRQNHHLFELLIQQKSSEEANPRFVEDFKTLADVLVQEMVKYEVGNQFPELRASIRGEENNTFTNKLNETVCVEIQDSAEQTASLLEIVLNGDQEGAEVLAAEVHRQVNLEEVDCERPSDMEIDTTNLGIWIDPIDSTGEYINGKVSPPEDVFASGLKCVTVLIGAYDKSTGEPLIGVVNRPFVQQEQFGWIGVCTWGACPPSHPHSPRPTNTICISNSEDRTVAEKLRNQGFKIVEAPGAGYKILTVILGLADAYVLTKNSTYKWDTCGPQAILRSLGGDIVICGDAMQNKLTSLKYEDNDSEICNIGGIIAFRSQDILGRVISSLAT